MASRQTQRFWEIDFFRGIAIIMMIIYHTLYDLRVFGDFYIELFSGFWKVFAYSTATLFLLLVGVSLVLSKQWQENKSGRVSFAPFFKRGLFIFFLGVLITFCTKIFIGQGFVVFGILHLIGLSLILSFPLLRFQNENLVFGVALIMLGLWLQKFSFSFPWLNWLGFIPKGFSSVDYYPLLPWFGVVLVGIFCGNFFFRNYLKRFKFPYFYRFRIVKAITFAGRKALWMYMLHQPVIITSLSFLGVISFDFSVT